MASCYNYPWWCDDYWRLERYNLHYRAKDMREMLEKRNYRAPTKANSLELERHLQRSDRGLRSYTNLTNQELRELLSRRGIETDFGPGNIGQRQDLIAALEDEDKNPRFYRFTQLPPELRNRIYDYYFAGFKDKLLHAPKQPPLTLTSCMVRSETLSLFYSSCLFAFAVVREFSFRGPVRRLNIPLETSMWLHNTKEKNLAFIRRLHVSVYRKSGSWRDVDERPFFAVEVDLEKDSDEGRYKITTDALGLDAKWRRITLEYFAKAFRSNMLNTVDKEVLFRLRRGLEITVCERHNV